MSKINSVKAREILDSRRNPTVEVDIVLSSDVTGRAAVPSGASTDTRETVEFRDNDKSRFHGEEVKTVIENATKVIAPKIVGVDVLKQRKIDQLFVALDGTKNKSRLDASAILSVSMAAARAASNFLNIPLFRYIDGSDARELPAPVMSVLNGGKRASNTVDVQEFTIMSIDADGFATVSGMCSEVCQTLKVVMKDQGMSAAVGDEGGFAPNLTASEDALKLIVETIEKTDYRSGEDVSITLDPAASEFYMGGKYVFQGERVSRSGEEMITLYSDWINKYPIISLEDGLAESSWDGWTALTAKLGNKVQLVGDDIFVTNPEILQEGVSRHIANPILIKPNQIGTFSETLDTIQMAHMAGYTTMISHHSGETEDTTMVNVAVTIDARQIRSGAPRRIERIMKYNQLPQVKELLDDSARLNGMTVKG